MDVGAYLIWGALLLAIGSIAFSLLTVLMHVGKSHRDVHTLNFMSKFFSIFVFISITMALLLLYHYFTSSNMNIQYVWEYSSRSLASEYKMSAVLAGMSGSLLFWVWCIVLAWFVEEIIDFRKPKSPLLMAITRIILMTIVTIFIGFLIIRDVFGETPQNFLDFAPDGNGLNPLLQTPLMIVHPPVVFIAYGFCVLPLAAAVGYLFTNDKKWVNLTLTWSRLAWLFLTLGIGVGGLWAYVVLGWGGYWAWDPVETSSFLPWLLLTAFLHAQLMFKRKGHYKFAAPALGIYTFALVIFATFTTRAGGLWISVHAFGSADVNVNPLDRLYDVLNSDGIIYSYFLLLMIILIGGTILLVWALIIRGDMGEEVHSPPGRNALEEMINDKSLMYVTLTVFSISTIITLILLILAINGSDRNVFDTRVGFFAIVGIVVLIACLAWKTMGRRIMLYSLGFAGALAFVLAALYPDNFIVATTMPFLILAVGASALAIGRAVNTRSLRGTINGIAPHFVHLGLVFILIGFIGSNFLITEREVDLDLNGSAEKIGNYEFRMVDVESSNDFLFVTIEIFQDGIKIGEARPGLLVIDGQARNEIDVVGYPFEDVYFTYQEITGTTATVTIKILPWMSLLWGGMWIMAGGIILRIVVDLTRPKAIKGETRAQMRSRMRGQVTSGEDEEEIEEEPPGPPDYEDKSDEYYEDLIEEELRKLD
jgi:cytochrome c-type biogenesis protein CcmF